MSSELNLIRSYLETHLPDVLKDRADQFVPLLSSKIKTICKDWLTRVREQAMQDPQHIFSGTLLSKERVYDFLKPSTCPDVLFYDQNGLKLLCEIFQNRYQIVANPQLMLEPQFDNSLLNVLPKADAYDVNFFWSPENPHVRTGAAKNFTPEIMAYLEQNLPAHLSERAEEYLPILTKKIDDICEKWLERVRAQAESTPNSIFKAKLLRKDRIYDSLEPSSLEGLELLDKKGGELIMKIFQSKFDIYATALKTINLYCNKNSLLDVLPVATIFDAEFTWTPTNLHVYAKDMTVKIVPLTCA